MIITITGKPGAGKSTVAKRLAKSLHYKEYNMGSVQRDLAKKSGYSLEEWQDVNENDDTIDKKIEAYQKRLGETEDNFIIEGRMSHLMIPHAVKIYLDVDMREAAHRVFMEKRGGKHNEKEYLSEEDLYHAMMSRLQSEERRWAKYYGVKNPHAKQRFDLYLDTTSLNKDDVFARVRAFIQRRASDR